MNVTLIINSGERSEKSFHFTDVERGTESVSDIKFSPIVEYGETISDDTFPSHEVREIAGVFSLHINMLTLSLDRITCANNSVFVYVKSDR